MDPNIRLQPGQQPSKRNPLAVMQPGEQVVCEIKRHPIGMIYIYAGAGFVLMLLAVMMLIIAPGLFGEGNESSATAIGSVVFLIVTVLILAYTFIANIVYWGNRWIVTDDSITQITQSSLFNKQSGQLSLESLEDVNAHKHGILPHLFNYGILKAETAGEHSKFIFIYCPHPETYAQKILEAREKFERHQQYAVPPPEHPSHPHFDAGDQPGQPGYGAYQAPPVTLPPAHTQPPQPPQPPDQQPGAGPQPPIS